MPAMPHRLSPPPRRGRTPSKPRRDRDGASPEPHARPLILEALARAEGGLTLTDVSQRVELPPSTTHRLLATLDRMGYVYQAGELGRWYVGLQAFAVGSTFLASRDFVAQSHPHMRRLMEQSGETANLAILDGTEAVFIDQVQCREMMRTIVKLGSRVPLHASGVGKALFAALPDEQIDAILKVKGLPRITEHTITSPETMWAALRVIRQRGWSFDDEEHALGTRCVAASGLRRACRAARRDLARRTVDPASGRANPAARPRRRARGGGIDQAAGRPLAASALASIQLGAMRQWSMLDRFRPVPVGHRCPANRFIADARPTRALVRY